MKNNLTYDFSINKENNTITVKREFDAELPLVWDAFTKREILDQWWAPKPWKAKTKTFDFKDGGQWHYAMVGPEGEEQWALSKFRNIQPQKSFSVSDSFADAEGKINNEMPQQDWTVTFIAKGDTTIVETLIKSKNAADLDKIIEMGFEDGYKTAFEGLDIVLEELHHAH